MSSPLPPLFAFTDPKRTPHPEDIAAHLPAHSALVYRHFGDSHAAAHARVLKTLSEDIGFRLFIGEDLDLALEVGAHGLHLREASLTEAPNIRKNHPHLHLTAACHSEDILDSEAVTALDAVFVSPVFASHSPSAVDVTPLGLKGVRRLCDLSPVPVYGLGGIGADTAEALTQSGLAGFGAIEAFQL